MSRPRVHWSDRPRNGYVLAFMAVALSVLSYWHGLLPETKPESKPDHDCPPASLPNGK